MSNELVHSKATWKRVCVAFGYCHMMPLHIVEVSGGNRILTVYRWETMSASAGLDWFSRRYDGLNSVGSDDERKFPYEYPAVGLIFSNGKSVLLLRSLLLDFC